MTEVSTFLEALSDRMTSTAYGVFDAARVIEQDISAQMVAGAEIIAELAHSLDNVPKELLDDVQHWLVTLGIHDFEVHLSMAFHQIMADAFHPSNATEFLQGLDRALTEKFGPSGDSQAADLAAAVVSEFGNQPLVIDLTELKSAQPEAR